MSESTENICNNKENHNFIKQDSVCLKSVRLTINILINILIFFTVFVCLLYSCNTVVTLFDMHIILCVLGYQFFMCQGTLVMSQYNAWSMFIKRRYKKHIHWGMQVFAAFLVTAGTVLIVRQKSTHFNSIHGQLGLAALVCCFVSLLNGVFAMFSTKLCSFINVFWIRFFHYITGIASMFLATGSLCAAFEYRSFKNWTGNGDMFVPILVSIAWLFTLLVSIDFWFVIGNKIKSLF